MSGFQILSVEDSFPWRRVRISERKLDAHTVAINRDNWKRDSNYQLLFTQTALKELFSFIGWNDHKCRFNRVEQMGLLCGRHYEDPETKRRTCVVLHILAIKDAKGTPSFIESSAEMLQTAIARLDSMSEKAEEPFELIGWFHTHPNGLPVFMSGTDMHTQQSVFYNDYNYSVVLNPHSCSWKVFRGYQAISSECRWLDTDQINLFTSGDVEPANPSAGSEEVSIDNPARLVCAVSDTTTAE